MVYRWTTDDVLLLLLVMSWRVKVRRCSSNSGSRRRHCNRQLLVVAMTFEALLKENAQKLSCFL